MVNSSKKQRMQGIKLMLLEMASGNFFYRLERSAKNDQLEAISITLNMLAEEIGDAMSHQGYVNSNHTLLDIIQMSFILDEEAKIEMANQQTCNILFVLHADIIGMGFIDFLEEASQALWQHTWGLLQQKEVYDTTVELTFKTKHNLKMPKTCHITTCQGKNHNQRKTLITVIHHVRCQDHLENDLKQGVQEFLEYQNQIFSNTQGAQKKRKIRLSFEDIRKIRNGHDIIIKNLEKDFPSLKDFALQLGTNEFKLKYGFKELYGITVHRFLMNERFRKAQMMVQFSDQSLKSIAHLTGFKSISHFSRTFKKRYGYTPSDLRKKTHVQGD